jgi:hypothetical protein
MLTPLQHFSNFLEHARQRLERIFVSESQDCETSLLQILISNCIIRSSFRCVMHSPIKFNHDSSRDRTKIHDVAINRLLTFEFNAIKWVAAQCFPKHGLSRCWGLSVGSSQLGEVRAGHRSLLYSVSRVLVGQTAPTIDASQTLSPLFSLRSKRPLPRAVAGEGFGERVAQTWICKSIQVHTVSRITA